jgi:hypothetical protein
MGNGQPPYLGLGLVGEAGEVADTLRRGMREGRLNEDRLAYELADLLFHWLSLCVELGLQPQAGPTSRNASPRDPSPSRLIGIDLKLSARLP